MKKILCLLFCIFGFLFALFWMITYIVYNNKDQIPNFITIIMCINIIFGVLALILGFCVIKVSIDQWFPNGDGDVVTVKDRVLIIIVFVITFICGGLFVLTIINNNINSIRVEEFDNIKLRILMLIMANTYISFAYYQHFQVVNLIE